MGERVTDAGAPRGQAATSLWSADCKDCRAERAAREERRQGAKKARHGPVQFEYAGSWATRKAERGESRSDRCERHRREHAAKIRALAVPYVDLRVIGEVANPAAPSGPLGGLGPLPVTHRERPLASDLATRPFGMTDADILTLLEGLSTKQVAIVEAGTGTGKSTFMPFRLMNPPAGAAWRPTDFGPIVVTEPRRVAATGVARFVGEALCYGCDSRSCSRHIGPGFQVGYQVKGEQHWDAACELIYVTDGTMINWVRDGRLARFSTVIIDEAHERSENIDIVLAQLRELLGRYDHLRVIIASATLDRDFFLSYFGGPEKVFELKVPATKSFGYGTPFFVKAEIDDTVLRDGLDIGGLTFPGWPSGPSDPAHGGEDLRQLSRKFATLRAGVETPIDKWRAEMPGAVVEQVVAIAEGTDWGDILAFLPTSRIIERVVDRIARALDDAGLDFDVYPLLSTTKQSIIDQAIAARSRGDRRRIVVSSNLAETSLTVEGMRFVVDSGLICQEEWDPELANGSLPVKRHSQSALRQRWGRVGRDMPGWVFPLYSAAQFLSLPRNTPPETSRKNLESHHMKLISSGLDPETMVLPGSHVAADADLDQAGRDHIDLFRRESLRARRALALAGAIDADGDLTAFGRDIERFSSDGATALAIMLGDQLACAHEVILAAQVLGAGQLVGTRSDTSRSDYILATDRAWPAAWRVRAAQAHRGLAVGCRDELDLLLRVASLYQTVPDPAAWCARWWVNKAMIEAALAAMMEQVDQLSAAMKEDAVRPIDPALAERARAVLSQAMVSARFRRAAEGHYVSEQDPGGQTVTLAANVVVPAPERLLAMERSRPGRGSEETGPRPAEISHLVEFLPWAALRGPGVEDLGLNLILRVAAHAGDRETGQLQRIQAVLEALPVGALADFEIGAGGALGSRAIAAAPSIGHAAALRAPSGARRERSRSGFDPDWDPSDDYLGEIPEEEQAQEVLKSAGSEANDEAPTAPPPPAAPAHPIELGRLIGRTSNGVLPAGKTRGMVVGYELAPEGSIFILVDPVAPDLALAEPGRHPDMIPWEEVDVVVGRRTWDHDAAFLQLDRGDRRGSFFLLDWGAGPDWFDTGFIDRLKTGTRLKARAVPAAEGGMTVTLLPLARELLSQAPLETRPYRDKRVRVFAGTIVGEPEPTGWADLELDQGDTRTGMAFRFNVHQNDLKKAGLSPPFAGARLFAALQPVRDTSRKASAADDADQGARSLRLEALDAAVAEKARRAGLEVNGLRIRAGPGELPFAAVAALVEASPDPAWRRAIWAFYEQSLHLSVLALYPESVLVELPVRVATLVAFNKAEFEAELDVTLYPRRSEAAVGLSAADKAIEAKAVKWLQALAKMPRLSVQVGRAKISWRDAKWRPGIAHASMDDGVLTLFGQSDRAVQDAMRAILMPARGRLSVPATKIGIFFGRGGSEIKRMCGQSGCRANSSGNDGQFTIEGPSATAVETFLALAKAHVPTAEGYVTDRGTLAPLPDPPRPSSAATLVAWRRANPDFFADAPLADLERIAGARSQLRPVAEERPPVRAKAVPKEPPKAKAAPVRRPAPVPKPGGFLSWLSKLFD